MSVLAAAFLLLSRQQGDGSHIKETSINRPGEKSPPILIRSRVEALEPPRKSPKRFGLENMPWEFPWLSAGYAYDPEIGKHFMRFRVYSQEHNLDRQEQITRMFMTLQQEALRRMKIDHADQYNGKIIDVFLCWGGIAGGEQRFDVVLNQDRTTTHVNTIYIYDLTSFKEPVEMAREIAHEYGHASLPPIGGYKEPENWANGYLGEKLYLQWVRQGMTEGRLTPDDVMGVSAADLDKWLAVNVEPLVTKAAAEPPSTAALNNPSKAGMDRYLGLAMYAATVLPDAMFGRSMLLTGSTDAKDYADALLLATEEPDNYSVKVPKLLANKPLWLPLGKGKVSGAKVLQYRGKWVQVQAPEGQFSVTNR